MKCTRHGRGEAVGRKMGPEAAMAYVRDILVAKGFDVHSLGPDRMVLDALELKAK